MFGPGTDEPLVQYEGSGTSTRRWFHADERGSVVAVSDASGDVVTAVNRYDEYGNVQGTLTGRFGYTGQAWLPEIGMAYYRARIYNPAVGRFMQTDPIGMNGGMNIYAYVGNNPVNASDPSWLTEINTGTRIPWPQNSPRYGYGGGLCGSCSGFGGAGFEGGGTDMNLYKITDWDKGTKQPIATWFDISMGGMGYLSMASAGGSPERRQRVSCVATPIWCRVLLDTDTRMQAARAWAWSMATGDEYGFWVTDLGRDLVPHGLIRGEGPNIFGYQNERNGASIWIHTHPFHPGERPGVTSYNFSTFDVTEASLNRFAVLAFYRIRRDPNFSFIERDFRRGQ